jgi:PTH2 family peptidyl-tRNA hydrolase
MPTADPSTLVSSTTVVSTSIVTFISGFLLGIFAIRGYLISPALSAERESNIRDPEESEESDIDEDDSVLDHAPNWGNSEEADRKQGLRQSAVAPATAGKKQGKQEEEESKAALSLGNSNEECKLVLVVRTDLGMTKGKKCCSPFAKPRTRLEYTSPTRN